MKSRSMCLSISKRTSDLPEKIEEYADMFGMSKAGTINYVFREFERLKKQERIQLLHGV